MSNQQPDVLRCAYCLKEADGLCRDHVVPRSRGGADNATNVVMACRSCNSAKSDRLPSEWLGDRCPPAVLMIEIREHGRLKKDFGSRRGRAKAEEPKRPALCAYSVHGDGEFAGEVEYIGEVVSEGPDVVRLNAVNALLFWGGLWEPSGALYDVPRPRCRIFADRDSCAEAAGRLIEAAHRRKAAACE